MRKVFVVTNNHKKDNPMMVVGSKDKGKVIEIVNVVCDKPFIDYVWDLLPGKFKPLKSVMVSYSTGLVRNNPESKLLVIGTTCKPSGDIRVLKTLTDDDALKLYSKLVGEEFGKC